MCIRDRGKDARTYDAPQWGFPLSYDRPAFLESKASIPAPSQEKITEPPKPATSPKAEKPKIQPFHETKTDKIDITHVLDETPALNLDPSEPKPEKW